MPRLRLSARAAATAASVAAALVVAGTTGLAWSSHDAAPHPSPAAAAPGSAGGRTWEAAARTLEISRTHAENALAAVAAGGGDRTAALEALDRLIADASTYESALDAFTPRLLDPSLPPAAADRNQAYVDVHRARRRALESARAKLAAPGRGARKAAQDALDVLAETRVLAPRDAPSEVAIRSVRRIPPRVAKASFKDLDDTRVQGKEESPDPLPLDLAPLPLDLAPPPPDVIARARAFGAAAPAEIARRVREEVSIAPFHALALGAAGCERDGRCTAFDAAMFLAELLRARGVPARLAYGVVDVDGRRAAARLIGAGTVQEALDALALGGVPAELDPHDSSRIRLEHVWVRARWQGAWLDLDPVFDSADRMLAPEVKRSAQGTNADAAPAALLAAYLADPADRTPIGAGMMPPRKPSPTPSPSKKKARGRTRAHAAPPPTRAKPVLAKGAHVSFRAAELSAVPAAYRASIELSVGGKSEAPLLDLKIPLADAAATGILLYPRPPSALDRRIASALGAAAPGGLNALPPHLWTATTVVAVGGKEIAALPPTAFGSQIAITLTLFPPNGTPVDVSEWAQAGAPAAITLVPFAPGPRYLPARWHEADAHPEGAAGLARALSATGAQLFADLLDETSRLASLAGGERFVSESVAIVAGSYHAPRGFAKAPLFLDPTGITMDVGRFDEILLARPGTRPVSFEVCAGAALSAWEARALTIATGLPAASTVVASKSAAASGGRPRILFGKPAARDLATLSPAGRAEVADALAHGLAIVLPRVPQVLDRWLGESYVLLDPRSGRGAYLLRGTLHGAVTTEDAGALLARIHDGGDLSASILAWRKGRAGRALLAREGWPAGLRTAQIRGVAPLLAAAARREAVAVPSTRLWPPLGGRTQSLELGTPIAVHAVGPSLWLGNRTRVLDRDVARRFAASPPRGFDESTRLWTGPSALAVVPTKEGAKLLPIPAPY